MINKKFYPLLTLSDMINKKFYPLLTLSELKTYSANYDAIKEFEKKLKDQKKLLKDQREQYRKTEKRVDMLRVEEEILQNTGDIDEKYRKKYGDNMFTRFETLKNIEEILKNIEEILKNTEDIKEEFRKKNEDNKFILMLLEIEMDENGNTQLHKISNTPKEFEKTIENFNDARLLNLPNKLGQTPLHLACESHFPEYMDLLYNNPKVNRDAIDNKGNNIFYYCFNARLFSESGAHISLFMSKVLINAASNLKLFMTPNFKGEFCLINCCTGLAKYYKIDIELWSLLLDLYENLTNNSSQQEKDKIIEDIEQRLRFIELAEYDRAEARAKKELPPQIENVKKESVDEDANQYFDNELEQRLPDFVTGLKKIISDKLSNITADNNQEFFQYISSSKFKSLKQKLITKIINNLIIALDKKISHEDLHLSINYLTVDKSLHDFLYKKENFIQLFLKNLDAQKFMCLKNLVDWAYAEDSSKHKQHLLQEVVEQILFKEIENTADLSVDMLLGFNVIDKDSWKSNNDVENIGEGVETIQH